MTFAKLKYFSDKIGACADREVKMFTEEFITEILPTQLKEIHLLSLPNITSMSISSSLCLKFPLLVLRYSGTEDTNFLK